MASLKERTTNKSTKRSRFSTMKRMSKSSPRNDASHHSRDQASSRIYKTVRNVYAVDFIAVLALFAIGTMYMFVSVSENNVNPYETTVGYPMPTRKLTMGSIVAKNNHDEYHENGIDIVSIKHNYEHYLGNAPVCVPLGNHEVTFSLVIALSEIEIGMVSHHCKRWGISAPISIAVWTTLSPEEIMDKLKSFDYNHCLPEQITIATLSPADGDLATISTTTNTIDENYPLNQLRNLAVKGIQTTHFVCLDIEAWTSADLYETLSSPSIVRELATNPRLAIVLPGFEIGTGRCSSSKDCAKLIPATFDALIIQLSEKTANVMNYKDISRQGSTLYRSWVRQAHGELMDIDCVSSNSYEPVLAVRYCEGLPPFQEILKQNPKGGTVDVDDDDDEDNARGDLVSTWIIHLLRLGYGLKQVGGAFVVNLASFSEDANSGDAMKSTEADGAIRRDGAADIPIPRLRRKKDKIHGLNDFLKWLRRKVPDRRSVQKCDDFDSSEDETP